MSSLERRLEALEHAGGGGLRIIWLRWLNTNGSRVVSAYVNGETICRRDDEGEDAFRQRLQTLVLAGERPPSGMRVPAVFLNQIDAVERAGDGNT